jgi:outer membrane protein OmpA-like peptidoglycan-associated protein
MTTQWLSVRLFSVVLLAAAGVLSGCAAGTRVTLLPDQSGHVGAVTVSDAQGQQRIDQAYNTVSIDQSSAPGKPRANDRQAFEKDHRALLDAQPTPPRSFVLNFLFDSLVLTPESKKMLPEVLQTVRDRSPTEVTVFGYADSSGTAAHNMALSAQRAQAVAHLLKQIDPNLPMEVKYFGDKAPLVATPPGTREPRNRRAEIFVL